MTDPLAPFFLGAYGENDDFFEKTLLELVRDHVFWRRNFHPEDEPPIGTHDQYTRAYLDGLARTRHELHQLTAALKRSVPSFHPRYLGHMVSDLLLPGLIAQLVTTLYNPNNIVEDVAPITVQLELEVGRQLARMLGLNVDPGARALCAGPSHLGRDGRQRRGALAGTVGAPLPARAAGRLHGDRHLAPGRAGPAGQHRCSSSSALGPDEVLTLARPRLRLLRSASQRARSCLERSPPPGSRSSASPHSRSAIPSVQPAGGRRSGHGPLLLAQGDEPARARRRQPGRGPGQAGPPRRRDARDGRSTTLRRGGPAGAGGGRRVRDDRVRHARLHPRAARGPAPVPRLLAPRGRGLGRLPAHALPRPARSTADARGGAGRTSTTSPPSGCIGPPPRWRRSTR